MRPIVRVYAIIVAACVFASAEASGKGSAVHLDPLDWEIELEFDGWSQQTKGGGETQIKRYTEKIEVSQAGYVISPRFFDFSVMLAPTFLQERSEGVTSVPRKGTVLDFDFELGMLRGARAPVSGSVGASSSTSNFSNGISGHTQQTSDSRFAVLDIKFLPFPMKLSYGDRTLDQIVTFGGAATQRQRNEFQRSVRWVGKSSKMLAQVEKRWFDDRVGENDYDSLEQSLTHDFSWGKNSHLATRQRYLSRVGTNPFEMRAFSEGVRLQHLTNLYSTLDYDYTQITRTVDTQSHAGRYALAYRPTEKLRLDFSARGKTQESLGGSLDDYGGRLGLAYNRAVLWNGALGLQLSGSSIRTDRQSNGTTIEAVDTSYTVPVTLLVLLSERAIDPSSILVTDSANSQVFLEGVDYIVRALSGDRTEMQILNSGLIAVGDSILVSYTATAQPSAQYDIGTVDANISIDYKWAKFYHSLRISNVALKTGSLGEGQDDVRDQRTGFEFRLDREWFEATARAESLSNKSGKFSRESLSFTETAHVEVSADTSLDLSASQISYENDGREIEVRQWNAHLTWAPLRGMTVKPHVNGWNRGEGFGQFEKRLTAGVDLTWRFRKFGLSLDVSHEELETETQDRSEQRVNIRIVRRS